jgi:hypothetical protein
MDIEGRSFIGGQLDAGRHTNKAIFPLSSIASSRWMALRQRRMFYPPGVVIPAEICNGYSASGIDGDGLTAANRG